MNEGSTVALITAAAPAIAVGAVLMHAVGVPHGLVAQQVLVFLVPAALLGFVGGGRPRSGTPTDVHWACIALAVSLVLPLAVRDGADPARWLHVGPIRLYLAPLVLPPLLILLGLPQGRRPETWKWTAPPVAGGALLLHPDAAQLSAFALASLPVLVTPGRPRTLGVIVAVGLLAAAAACWQRPDPLMPVDHVEGVLRLARARGPATLLVAIAVAILPAVTLHRHASRLRSRGLLAAAIYYAVLIGLAPLEVTPVPLLGFGAGPILGYLSMTAVASTVDRDLEDRPRTHLAHRGS